MQPLIVIMQQETIVKLCTLHNLVAETFRIAEGSLTRHKVYLLLRRLSDNIVKLKHRM